MDEPLRQTETPNPMGQIQEKPVTPIEKLERRFAEVYVKNGFKGAPAVREIWGSSIKRPESKAYRLLRKDRVTAVIAELVKSMGADIGAGRQYVAEKWKAIAESNQADYWEVDADGFLRVKDITRLPAEVAERISEVKAKPIFNRDGEQVAQEVLIKLWDKQKALDSMAKHWDMFSADEAIGKGLSDIADVLKDRHEWVKAHEGQTFDAYGEVIEDTPVQLEAGDSESPSPDHPALPSPDDE